MSGSPYTRMDVAIIGMSGRFPEADTPDQLWGNLLCMRESVSEFPESRRGELKEIIGSWAEGDFTRGGYVDRVTTFEPEYFSISQEEIKYIDPQHRLLLELVEEAILHAGYNPEMLANRYVGVFIAENRNNYIAQLYNPSPMVMANNMSSSGAGRIAYTYNFRGPVLTMGTACSSSLVSVHYACQSLRANEVELCIAGASELILLPIGKEEIKQFNILSENQQVRAFDQDADGTVFGEGGGVLLLKLAEQAWADGDPIIAVIKGSAVNSDGNWSNGMMSPSELAQTEVILRAVENAKIDPRSISYIETHGTGTKIGDPIEIQGIQKALDQLGYPRQSVPIGSIKTNIGHLNGAAGIASLIKTVLALQNKQIPASINFTGPNPLIDFLHSPVYVNDRTMEWNVGSVRRAGVTALGLTGTNCHVIVEEAPVRDNLEDRRRHNLIMLSARTEPSLQAMIMELIAYIETHQGHLNLDEIAFTLNTGRRMLKHVLVTFADDIDELLANLKAYEAGIEQECVHRFEVNTQARLSPIFIFPAWKDVDLSVYEHVAREEELFRTYWAELRQQVPADVNADDPRVRYLLYSLACIRLLEAYSIKPKALLGMGAGKIVANQIRKQISFQEAVQQMVSFADLEDEMGEVKIGGTVQQILASKINLFLLFAANDHLSETFTHVIDRVNQNHESTDDEHQVVLIALDRRKHVLDRTIIPFLRYGVKPDWKTIYQSQNRNRIALPGYVFARKSYFARPDRAIFAALSHSEIAAGQETAFQQINSREEITAKLQTMLSQLTMGTFTVHDHFTDMELDSIGLFQFAAKVKKEFQIEVPFKMFFEDRTIGEILQIIANMILESAKAQKEIAVQPMQEDYPLSSAQRRVFVMNQIIGANTSYNLPGVMTIQGNLDRDRFEGAIRDLIQRHQSLRTSFEIKDGKPVQRIHSEVDFTIQYYDLQDEFRLKEIIERFIRPFDLSTAPLLRVGLITVPDRYYLLFDWHHIITDGTSIGIMMRDFVYLYEGRELPRLRIQYTDYAVWHHQFLESPELKRQEEYWLDQFLEERTGKPIPILNLPTDYQRPSRQSYEGERLHTRVEPELLNQLQSLAKREGTTLFVILFAAYNVLLAKYTGQDDIIVGTPIVGRPDEDVENVIGMFVNTLVLRNDPTKDKSFSSFVREVRDRVLTAFENQDYQFQVLVERLRLDRDLSHNPLFDTMFRYHNFKRFTAEKTELEYGSYPLERDVAQFDLMLTCEEGDDGLHCTMEYCTKLFLAPTIARMAEHFRNVLMSVVNQPEQSIADLEMLSSSEKEMLLAHFNDTEIPYAREATIHQLFEEQVKKTPGQIALVVKEQELTYHQLNQKANQMARYLRREGVGRETIVGLLVRRSVEMVVGLLAILKAGGAYLPIDPEYPENRMQHMLEDSEASVLITDHFSEGKIHFSGKQMVLDSVQLLNDNPEDLPNLNESTDLCYLIYTSGSTGKPKGTMLEHRSVNNFIQGVAHEIKFTPGKTVLSLTTISFDIFVLETLLPWSKGAKVVVADEVEIMEPKRITDLIVQKGVDLIQMTPSRVKLWMENAETAEAFARLKEILVGGEACDDHLLKDLQQKTQARIWNMYGPTEATVWSTMKDLTTADKVTIGKPIANTRLYILDEHFHLVPEKVVGDLYIAGDGLARGYYHRPDLTAERFIANPFEPGQKMYKTGDIARWLSNGEVEFLGRKDRQVKIRGYRIETSEIEIGLSQYPTIKESVVQIKESATGYKYLVAYYVAEEEVNISALRTYLLHHLPEYMVPSFFVYLEQFPLTPNGKVDYLKLPEVDHARPALSQEYAAPESDLQKQIAQVWAEILEMDLVGVHDNFFELGGNSITLITMHNQIDQLYPGKLTTADLFAYPTIARIAEYLEEQLKDDLIDREAFECQQQYWQKELEGDWKLITLPENFYTHTALPSVGMNYKFEIKETLYEQLVQMAEKENVDVHDILTALYLYLLSEMSGQTDLVIGAMRKDHPETIFPLRVNFAGISDLNQLFRCVHQKYARAVEMTVHPIHPAWQESREPYSILPLFSKLQAAEQLEGYDLLLNSHQRNEMVALSCSYDAMKLDGIMVEQLVHQYSNLIQMVLDEYHTIDM